VNDCLHNERSFTVRQEFFSVFSCEKKNPPIPWGGSLKLNQRHHQKLRTRQGLLDATLKLMGENKSLGELSLREIAGEAGIVPAGFYRHFQNTEELGLALVDELGGQLRGILREARKKGAYKTALQGSMAMFFDYVKKNRLLFRFICRERTGGTSRIRSAIRNEMSFIAGELASDMRLPRVIRHSEVQLLAELIVTNSFHMAAEYMDADPQDLSLERKIQAKTVKQLRLFFLGVLQKKGRKRK